MSTSIQSLTFRLQRQERLTTVIHAIESSDVYFTQVQPLANDLIKVGYGGGDCGDAIVLVEGEWSVVHDRLIIIGCVQISDEIILILIEIVLFSCGKSNTTINMCKLHNETMTLTHKERSRAHHRFTIQA